LSFANLVLNIFEGELPPNPAVSDFYIFARGGAALPDSSTPNAKAVENVASNPPPKTQSPQPIKTPTGTSAPNTSYKQPTKDTPDLILY
jgi:hypothetical protein